MALPLSSVDLDTSISKNHKVIVRCPFEKCNVRIIGLSPDMHKSVATVTNAPQMMAVSKDSSEDLTGFYQINDMWDFDNMGVSRASEDLPQPLISVGDNEPVNFGIERLLVCSECERGPLGFAGYVGDVEKDPKNLRFYLSKGSVLYDVKEE